MIEYSTKKNNLKNINLKKNQGKDLEYNLLLPI